MRRLITIISIFLTACLILCSCGKVNGYNKKDLVPVNDNAGNDSILAYVVDYNAGKDITVKIKNNTDKVFAYGEYYTIQVFIEGVWYYVPYTAENVVHDLAHELQPGQAYTQTYSLYPYGGKLNPGHYRIACCDIGDGSNIYYAEFNVMADMSLKWEIVEPTVAG